MDVQILRLAEAAGQAAQAEQVLVFGSRARGDATADSDVDLALIVPDQVSRREALRAAIKATAVRDLPLDLVVLAHSNWTQGRSLLARQIRQEGQVVYGN
jgi:predicted nucleotidyltransferase